MLRSAVGLSAAVAGIFYLSGSSNSFTEKWLFGSVLIISGGAAAAGFLTPAAAILIGMCSLGIALAWITPPPVVLPDVKLMALGLIITAIALALLGPGAFSLDGRLFGRREIVIPPSPRKPEP